MDFFTGLAPLLIWGGIYLAITYVFAWCSMRSIVVLKRIINTLQQISDTTQLVCNDKKVSAIGYDEAGSPKEYLLYWNILCWQGGTRSVKVVKQFAQDQYTMRLVAWCILAIPTFLISIYWGIYHHQNAFAVTVGIVIEQFYPFLLGPDIFEAVKMNLK